MRAKVPAITVQGVVGNPERLERMAEWAGFDLDASKVQRFIELAAWLVREAIPGGGLGPGEADRVWDRHILDSLALARGFPSETVGRATDLGSGVGLPGLPLAIATPDIEWSLVDRAGRRTDLAARAVRILGLENVSVVQGDMHRIELGGLAVSRAATAPDNLIAMLRRRFSGVAVIALSRSVEQKPAQAIGKLVEVPAGVLDGGGQFLIIDFRD